MNTEMQQNDNDNYVFQKEFFYQRQYEEVEGGQLREDGFYFTLDGSFWDDDGDYFNKYGYDKYGGRYDEFKVYCPGEGWLEEFQCYREDLGENNQEEIKDIIKDRFEESLSGTDNILAMMENERENNSKGTTSFSSNVKSQSTVNNIMNSNSHHGMSTTKMDVDLDHGNSNFKSNSADER